MANKISQLRFDSIMLDVNANSMKQAYQIMADQISQLIGTPKQHITLHLLEAEKEDSAAIGNGIAIDFRKFKLATNHRNIWIYIR